MKALCRRIASCADYTAAFDAASGQHPCDSVAVSDMLFGEDAGGKRFNSVAIHHGDGALQNDGPVVKMLVHKVDCASAELCAIFERLLLRVHAGECGQQ